ncbi:hypothetical protein [Streptomyces sp. NPDC057460]|uniref:hypothetical protein n=1 Tax=Streptomyces sp. NPDC057460 TaxID=3346141 RepID=UPI0036ADF02B
MSTRVCPCGLQFGDVAILAGDTEVIDCGTPCGDRMHFYMQPYFVRPGIPIPVYSR